MMENSDRKRFVTAVEGFSAALAETATMFRAHGLLVPVEVVIPDARGPVRFVWNPGFRPREENGPPRGWFSFYWHDEPVEFEMLAVQPNPAVEAVLHLAIAALFEAGVAKRDETIRSLGARSEELRDWMSTIPARVT